MSDESNKFLEVSIKSPCELVWVRKLLVCYFGHSTPVIELFLVVHTSASFIRYKLLVGRVCDSARHRNRCAVAAVNGEMGEVHGM